MDTSGVKTSGETLCTSVFLEGDDDLSARVTAKWIALIRQLEQNKALTAPPQRCGPFSAQ